MVLGSGSHFSHAASRLREKLSNEVTFCLVLETKFNKNCCFSAWKKTRRYVFFYTVIYDVQSLLKIRSTIYTLSLIGNLFFIIVLLQVIGNVSLMKPKVCSKLYWKFSFCGKVQNSSSKWLSLRLSTRTCFSGEMAEFHFIQNKIYNSFKIGGTANKAKNKLNASQFFIIIIAISKCCAKMFLETCLYVQCFLRSLE